MPKSQIDWARILDIRIWSIREYDCISEWTGDRYYHLFDSIYRKSISSEYQFYVRKWAFASISRSAESMPSAKLHEWTKNNNTAQNIKSIWRHCATVAQRPVTVAVHLAAKRLSITDLVILNLWTVENDSIAHTVHEFANFHFVWTGSGTFVVHARIYTTAASRYCGSGPSSAQHTVQWIIRCVRFYCDWRWFGWFSDGRSAVRSSNVECLAAWGRSRRIVAVRCVR